MDSEDVELKKILIITYAFPPAAYVGVHRTAKYCRHLGKYGWQPLVLTIKPTAVSFRDDKLCRQIPDYVEVFRTMDIDPAKWLDWISRMKKSPPSGHDASDNVVDKGGRSETRGVLATIKAGVVALLTRCPDSHIFWAPFALFKGIGVLLRRKVDVIYSTSPPHSSHIISYLLAKLFRKPYVLDFRDPWEVGKSGWVPGWSSKVESGMKRLIIRNASKVIVVSEGERKEIVDEYPAISQDFFACITNGYEPSDFSSIEWDQGPTDKLTIVHAGTMYGGEAGEFLGALELLLSEDSEIGSKMQVNLVGDIADIYIEQVRYLESRGVVHVLGLKPHATALRSMMEGDVLCILLGGNRFLTSEIPAKTFEYLYTEKPILAITREGDLSDVMQKSGLGIVVPPGSADRVASVLRDIHAAYLNGELARIPNRAYIRSFDRVALTRKLAVILNEVVQNEKL